MKRVLILGATGNVGKSVIKYLCQKDYSANLIAGVRDIEKSKKILFEFKKLDFIEFDFENGNSIDLAFRNIDSIFLLRPPHISYIPKYFKPLIDSAKTNDIKEIIFLSVQGVEKGKIIPHHKIENLIRESGIDYIFLRPSYFMQNLITTLLPDILRNNSIVLPAGNSKFNWIDVENIGEFAAEMFENSNTYKNHVYEICGSENLNFYKVTKIISKTLSRTIEYRSTNPFSFYFLKKKEGYKSGMILVMILLHFLPRFQKATRISKAFRSIIGREPNTIVDFLKREKSLFD